MRLTVEKLKKDIANNYDILTYISDRGGWKSTTVQVFMLDEAMNDRPFALIRTKIDEKITDSWLSSYTRAIAQERKLEFWTEKIDTYVSCIKFKDKDCKEHIYCYGIYLSVAEKYKSNYYKGFEKIRYIVWEECVPTTQQVQDVNYCVKKYMQNLYNIMSIGSTICRDNKRQYIFLGNDISHNIINSITVSFNLLERLKANCEIIDIAIIDDVKYNFYFSYFDYEDATNHWLTNNEFDISQDVIIDKQKRYPFILETDFYRYYIYNCGKFLYITDTRTIDIEDVISTEEEFFTKYHARHLLDIYGITTALITLETLYGVPAWELQRYYGANYLFDKNPRFTKLEKPDEQHLINIEECSNMKLASIMTCKNFNDVMNFYTLINDNNVVYSNIKLKVICEKLKSILLFA